MSGNRKASAKVWFARCRAAVWVVLTPCALLWWPDSVAFVIVASMYANVVSDLSVAEAADDNKVLDRVDRVEQLLGEASERAARLERLLVELVERSGRPSPADEPVDPGEPERVELPEVPAVDMLTFVEWRLFELFGTVDPVAIRDAGGDVGYISAAVDLAAARAAEAAEAGESDADGS